MDPFTASIIVSLVISLASMAVGYLLMPKPSAEKPDHAKGIDKPTVESRPIPVVFGEDWVPVQILHYSKKSTHTYQISA